MIHVRSSTTQRSEKSHAANCRWRHRSQMPRPCLLSKVRLPKARAILNKSQNTRRSAAACFLRSQLWTFIKKKKLAAFLFLTARYPLGLPRYLRGLSRGRAVEWHEFNSPSNSVGKMPHQPIEYVMRRRAAIEIGNHCLDNSLLLHRYIWQCFVQEKTAVPTPQLWYHRVQPPPFFEKENLEGSHDHPMGERNAG